jgi:YkoY family integral membrane protein
MDLIYNLLGTDLEAAAFVIFNLILIESLLSIDNAAVLATMVMDLPEKQRNRALKYGILGAYVFRGISLLLASYLITILWLKFIGGLYLLWLCIDYFRTKATPSPEDDTLNKLVRWLVHPVQDLIKQIFGPIANFFNNKISLLGQFWSTVVMVEVMDLAFSIDNVFAAVAFTDKIFLICLGVFIGILSMRFVAQLFVRLMELFPFLEAIAFVVIGVLGLKLVFSYLCDSVFGGQICQFLNGHEADLYVSLVTVAIFTLPILSSLLFNFPKRHKADY